MAHPVREAARKALTEIWKEMKKLETFNETLDARYVRMAKAVGVYDGAGKRLDHTRFNNYRN